MIIVYIGVRKKKLGPSLLILMSELNEISALKLSQVCLIVSTRF